MIIPFVGATYQMEAKSFDVQRCVNLFPILAESQTSKSVAALRGTSGLSLFATLGGGAVRGGIESEGRCFFVSANTLYELDSLGNATNHGTINTFTGNVSIEENPTQLMIIDDTYGYIFNKTTDTLTQITDADFPTPLSLTYQDGYFIVVKADSSKIYISAINDGTTWSEADSTTVESNPDKLVSAYSDSSNLWLFGTKTTEIFRNTGNAVFPFQRIEGAIIETGCAADGTVKEINNRIFWLAVDENGDSVVMASNGYGADRVSTQAVERILEGSTDVERSYAWVYQERGHSFYCLQAFGLNTTLVFDVATGMWHERTYRNTLTNAEEQHRGSCHVFFSKMHLVGDRENGKVYKMSLDTYSDNGDPIIRQRIGQHIDEEKRLISHNQFELDMEVGVGLQNGQGSDPKIMMQYSDDGGHTWSSELWRSIGKVGEYKTRVVWNKLGASRDRVYKIKISDPVFVQINEAYLNNT